MSDVTKIPYSPLSILQREGLLLPSYTTTIIFLLKGKEWLAHNPGFLSGGGIFIWLFVIMLLSSFAVSRHADHLAEVLKEPLGTLILTLAVTSIEVVMISVLMFNGNNPGLARDTMFAVVMIVLGGLLGIALLTGGLRFSEQQFNIKGTYSFLGLILPLSVLSLVMPNFTESGGDRMFSPFHALMMILLSLGIYGIFLAIQTKRHREFFNEIDWEPQKPEEHHQGYSVPVSALLLILHLLPVVLLAKQLAHLLDYGVQAGGMPEELGGMVVAILILAPEGLSAIQSAVRNQVQRSVNVLLGSVLATIGLTVPASLVISLISGKPVQLGLSSPYMTLLAVTLGSCMITFGQGQTNILQGFVHLLLFIVYIMLMFH